MFKGVNFYPDVKCLTGIAVVGVVVISIGIINVVSYVTEKINNLSTHTYRLKM